MQNPEINDRVRLIQNVPDLALMQGQIGVVQSMWFSPTTWYEVEFPQPGEDAAMRALLSATQIELTGRREMAV